MKQDSHQRAKERYADAQDYLREQHAQILEDLRFSNPSDPQQWPEEAYQARQNRPRLTFDRTNQFIQQVVNDGRQNKPSIKVLPADSKADVKVAEKYNGIIRHIEYVSRAGIAYDTALDLAARCGLGWLRVVPQVIDAETNQQEIRILRVHDSTMVCLNPDSTQPDGSDARWGFAETFMSSKAFAAAYPKATPVSMDGGNWSGVEGVKLCEYFEIESKKENRIVLDIGQGRQVLTEEQYWAMCREYGQQLPYISAGQVAVDKVLWQKMTGAEVLESTYFPGSLIPLIPVIGDETWIRDKRYLCGITRKQMDQQRFHNYSISQLAETIALQPKSPFIGTKEAIAGNEMQWARANSSQDAILLYNHLDENGNPLPQPNRQNPPVMSQGWAELLQYSTNAMEASVGMYKESLGQQGNATSGKAIRARQKEGDTATFHYVDNLSRSIEQLGRVVVGMIPIIYDRATQARIVGEDGKQDFVSLNPATSEAVTKDENGKTVSYNLGVGAYDVRCTAGPSFTTSREEAAQNIIDISQGNPQLGAALAPLLMQLRDMPDSEKAYKIAVSLLPPEVQKAYENDSEDGEAVDPKIQAITQQAQQAVQQAQMQCEQLKEGLQEAAQEHAEMVAKLEKAEIDLKRERALSDIKAAQNELEKSYLQGQPRETIEPVEREAIQQPQPTQPMQPMIMPDVNGQLAEAMTGMTQALAQSMQNTEQAVAAVMEGQAQLLAMAEQTQAATLAAVVEANKPKQSIVKVQKQPDGSFIGIREEVNG